MSTARALLAAAGFMSVFIAPPWIPALCILLLALRWRAPEAVIIGVLVDLTWLTSDFVWGLPFATLLSVLLLWILEPFRRELLVDHRAV